MKLNAYAKINLSLDILGKRDDGYHEIASFMQSVSLCDEVEIEKNDTGEITLTTDCPELPNDERNIAYRACALMKDAFHLSCGFDISIKKRIPLAGGMAGGSTDAAAVIRGVNELCSLNLSVYDMMDLGVKIGADVPFCIFGKPALATGIGEILLPAVGLPSDCYILLVNPGVSVSTKELYEEIDGKADYGEVNNRALLETLANGRLDLATKYMVNVFEPVTGERCLEIFSIISAMKTHGAIHAMMSGSGATCFGIFREKPDVEKIKMRFPNAFVSLEKPQE